MMKNPHTMRQNNHIAVWRCQATIITECRQRSCLRVLNIHVRDASPERLTMQFVKTLRNHG